MYITDHAKERAHERFGIPATKIQSVVDRAPVSFWIIDRKKSYDHSIDIGPKRVIRSQSPLAYFVVDADDRLVTVLTESMAMHNFKVGKWTKT